MAGVGGGGGGGRGQASQQVHLVPPHPGRGARTGHSRKVNGVPPQSQDEARAWPGVQGSTGQTQVQWRERTAQEGLRDGQAQRRAGEGPGPLSSLRNCPSAGSTQRGRGGQGPEPDFALSVSYTSMELVLFFFSMVFMKKIKKKDCCNRTTDVDLKKPFRPRSLWGHLGVERGAQAGVAGTGGAGTGIQGAHSESGQAPKVAFGLMCHKSVWPPSNGRIRTRAPATQPGGAPQPAKRPRHPDANVLRGLRAMNGEARQADGLLRGNA